MKPVEQNRIRNRELSQAGFLEPDVQIDVFALSERFIEATDPFERRLPEQQGADVERKVGATDRAVVGPDALADLAGDPLDVPLKHVCRRCAAEAIPELLQGRIGPDVVGIEECEKAPLRQRDSAVSSRRGPLVRLRDEHGLRKDTPHERLRRNGGAIIDHDHFVVPESLGSDALERSAQMCPRIEGRDDDAHVRRRLPGHARAPLTGRDVASG